MSDLEMQHAVLDFAFDSLETLAVFERNVQLEVLACLTIGAQQLKYSALSNGVRHRCEELENECLVILEGLRITGA